MTIGPAASVLEAADVRYATLAAGIEALRSGTTTILDSMYAHPVPRLSDKVIGAFNEVGLRCIYARAFRDLGSDSKGHSFPGNLVEDVGNVSEDVLRLVKTFGSPSADGMIRIWLAPTAARIADLGVGEQQRVEILKALYRGAEVLILDEPTAVLTPQETKELFATLRLLVAEGKSVVFISHKLNEVMEISHKITVLRSGKVIGTVPAADTSKEKLAKMMVGRSVAFEVEREAKEAGEPVLEVKDLVVRNARGLNVVNGATFEVRTGEILGVAGVDGNGREEMVEALAGMRRLSGVAVRIGGRDIAGLSLRQVASMGVAHIPASRQETGLILDMTVAENLILQSHYRSPFSRGGNLDLKVIREVASRLGKCHHGLAGFYFREV